MEFVESCEIVEGAVDVEWFRAAYLELLADLEVEDDEAAEEAAAEDDASTLDLGLQLCRSLPLGEVRVQLRTFKGVKLGADVVRWLMEQDFAGSKLDYSEAGAVAQHLFDTGALRLVVYERRDAWLAAESRATLSEDMLRDRSLEAGQGHDRDSDARAAVLSQSDVLDIRHHGTLSSSDVLSEGTGEGVSSGLGGGDADFPVDDEEFGRGTPTDDFAGRVSPGGRRQRASRRRSTARSVATVGGSVVAGGLVAGPVGAVVAGAVSGALVARNSKDGNEDDDTPTDAAPTTVTTPQQRPRPPPITPPPPAGEADMDERYVSPMAGPASAWTIAGDRTVIGSVVRDHTPLKRGSRTEDGTLVKYHEVPVHRFCERWLYRYGGDSDEQIAEQKRAPFKVVLSTEVDSDHRLAILDWHETKGRGESYVEYRIRVQSGANGPTWDVWHRYSDFEKLHDKLFKGNGRSSNSRGRGVLLGRVCPFMACSDSRLTTRDSQATSHDP